MREPRTFVELDEATKENFNDISELKEALKEITKILEELKENE